MSATDDVQLNRCDSLAVSLSILANAIGSLFWATYSGFCAFLPENKVELCMLTYLSTVDGRRPILLLSMSIFCVGSFGSGIAWSVPQLLIWRVIQAFGASSGLSVGIGVLADIYKMEERGTASGAFFGVRCRLFATMSRSLRRLMHMSHHRLYSLEWRWRLRSQASQLTFGLGGRHSINCLVQDS